MTINREWELIRREAGRLKPRRKGVVVGIGDDAAVVACDPRRRTLLTADLLIEGVHFRRGEDPRRVGHKALAVSVSDIAAMGGVPLYALVTVGLPKGRANRVAAGLFKGLRACASRYGVDIVGGDTNKSDRLIVDVFLVGEAKPDEVVVRSGARPGDTIFVSGPLGGSLARGRHLDVVPRLDASRFLAGYVRPTSMIDLSDGLATDLNRICEASRAGALIVERSVPLHPDAKDFNAGLTDGEDFELLFTLDARGVQRLAASTTRLRFFPVGVMTAAHRGVRCLMKDGRIAPLAARGFSHF